MTDRELMQQALEALVYMTKGTIHGGNDLTKAAITALRERLAQPVQEPALEVEREPDYWSGGHFHEGVKPHIDPTKIWSLPIGTKLYTAPQPRQWQGLARLEFQKAVEGLEDLEDCWIAIEAALREKNT